MFSKKINFILLGLFSLFSFGYFSKTNAEIITSTLTDTYTINLSGIHLNNVNGLNIKIKLPRKQADITTGVTFKGTGANVLLSTVTGPSAEEYTISLVLTGMITDGKATITGKFIDGSIISGAEFLVTSITQDGGTDLTSLLTKEVVFSNSKATPTPTATPSATPNEENPIATPTPSATISQEAQEIIDLIVSENGELEIDPSEFQEALAGDESAKVKVTTAKNLQLKKNGLNKIFFRLNGSIGKGYTRSFDHNYISCLALFGVLDNGTSSDFLKTQAPVFSAPIPKGNSKTVFRFSKRGTISILPEDTGLELLSGGLDSVNILLLPVCLTYDKNEGEEALAQYARDKGKSVDSLNSTETLFGLLNIDSKIILDSTDIKLLAPKAADINSGN